MFFTSTVAIVNQRTHQGANELSRLRDLKNRQNMTNGFQAQTCSAGEGCLRGQKQMRLSLLPLVTV